MNILCINWNIFHSSKLNMVSMYPFKDLIHDLLDMFAQF